MQASSLSRWSYLSLFFAAAASLATSAPAPDWVIEDTASGEVTLSPDADETLIHLRVSSHLVSSILLTEVALDPPPQGPATSDDVSDTPILLFVGAPTVVTPGVPTPTSKVWALPTRPAEDGFEHTPGAAPIAIDSDEAVDIRVTWKSAREDRLVTKTVTKGSTSFSSQVERPLAPRRLVKIRWRARLSTSGYGDRPDGSVNVEPAS